MVSPCIEFLFQEGVRSRPGPGQLRWQNDVTAQRDLMKAASSRPGYEGTTCCLAGVMGGVKTAVKKGFWWRPLPICRGCPGKARLMRRDETPGAVCHLCATAKACVWTAFGESCNENSRLPHAKPVSGLIRRDPWRAYGCWSVVWQAWEEFAKLAKYRCQVVEDAPRGAELRRKRTQNTRLLRATSAVSSAASFDRVGEQLART